MELEAAGSVSLKSFDSELPCVPTLAPWSTKLTWFKFLEGEKIQFFVQPFYVYSLADFETLQ